MGTADLRKRELLQLARYYEPTKVGINPKSLAFYSVRWDDTPMVRRHKAVVQLVVLLFCGLATLGYLLADQLILMGLGIWVSSFDHHDLEIVAYDDSGHQLDSVSFFRTWFPAMVVRDRTGVACFGMQHGLGFLRIAVPTGDRVTLDILWPVPGFGKVLLTADNGGIGYSTDADSRQVIELPEEFARSRIARVRRWIAEHVGGTARSYQADAELKSAENLLTQGGAAAVSERGSIYSAALRLAMVAGEDEVLSEAREAISRRRGEISVQITDSSGAVLRNAPVWITQQRPNFDFGVYDDQPDAYSIKLLTQAGLNYAAINMSWPRTEPQQDLFSFASFDQLCDLGGLEKTHASICAHNLVRFTPGDMPAYMKKFQGDPVAISNVVREHLRKLVAHYGDRVAIWEINNEGNAAWARWGLDENGMLQVLRAAAEEVRKDAPRQKILVSVTLPLGEDAAFKNYPLMGLMSYGQIDARSIDTYQWVRDLKRAGVPYDLLGLQFYNGAYVYVIPGGIQVEYIDMFRFACELDRFAGLGKPLLISELSVGTYPYKGRGSSWWHGCPSQAVQADFLADAFTIAYGDGDVQGINWWNLFDKNSFAEEGGLVDLEGRPKLAYFRLAELLQNWRSEKEKITGQDGSVTFDVLPGEYRVKSRIGAIEFAAVAQVVERTTTHIVLAPRKSARATHGVRYQSLGARAAAKTGPG
jgi:GH35 family endo-1,4-beta-xylanase